MSGKTTTGAEAANERMLAEQWLSAELNRMWLVAERCLRQFQRAQLRPQPDSPQLAEIEGIFTARRAARGGRCRPRNSEWHPDSTGLGATRRVRSTS
mgnify:CR=1 FL=1